MTVETVSGSTPRGSLFRPGGRGRPGGQNGSGGARRESHGLAVTGVAHGLARHRRVPAQLAAELADEPRRAPGAVLVEVHLLPDQRRAAAVGALRSPRLELAEPAHHQLALELLDVILDGTHGTPFGASARGPPSAVSRPR